MKKANHSNAENHNKAAAHAKSWMAYITVIEANEYQDSTKTGRIKQELHQELNPWGFDINIFALIQVPYQPWRSSLAEQGGKPPGTPGIRPKGKRSISQPKNRPLRLVYKLPDPLLFQPLLSMYRGVFLLDEILSFGAKVFKPT